MASKLAVYDTGYEDERFQQIVSQSFHCIICTNVIKDPVMCRQNEHIFCRGCITRHLTNSQSCPTCMEPLTVGTLNQAPRGIRNLLAELNIRCEFFGRGCEKFIELGDLERHVRECGFAPAVCSNEGCQLQMNKRDILHHESTICELRKVKCHSCNDIRQEMDAVKVSLVAMNEKLDRNEKKLDKHEENLKTVVDNVLVKVEMVQEQLNNQEINNHHVQEDIVEMKKSLNEITKQLERMIQRASDEVSEQEKMQKGTAEADGMDGVREPKVVVAGSWTELLRCGLNSVEMFSLSNETWTPLEPMKAGRSAASSVVYNDHIFVIGGYLHGVFGIKSMEKLSLKAVQTDQSITWEKCTAELSKPLAGQCSVVYDGRLIVLGGCDTNIDSCSDSITEVSLVPPYTNRLLAVMPQKLCDHAVALFGDEIVILGGRENIFDNTVLTNVVIYNITKNECKKLEQLPYPVGDMATVKWGDDNVIIIGGADSNYVALNKVLMYNVKTQKSHALPNMKHKRKGCVAAVVGDTVIVMGGTNETGDLLKSAESFRFDNYSWKELPEMHDARYWATAVVC